MSVGGWEEEEIRRMGGMACGSTMIHQHCDVVVQIGTNTQQHPVTQ